MSKRTKSTKKSRVIGIEEKDACNKGVHKNGRSGNRKTDIFYACPVKEKDEETRKTRKNSSKPKKK